MKAVIGRQDIPGLVISAIIGEAKMVTSMCSDKMDGGGN